MIFFHLIFFGVQSTKLDATWWFTSLNTVQSAGIFMGTVGLITDLNTVSFTERELPNFGHAFSSTMTPHISDKLPCFII